MGCSAYGFHTSQTGVVTQKARGILQVGSLPGPLCHFSYMELHGVLRAEDVVKYGKTGVASLEGNIFARPCPTRPMHGFVESRVVCSEGDLCRMAREVYEQDKSGEIVLCDFIPSMYNVVWRTNGMTIGPGHAGATSGVNSIDVPLVELPNLGLSRVMTELAGIWDSPFVELVMSHEKQWFVTQLRDGPEVSSTADYIPKRILVSNVFVLEKEVDLLQWANTVASMPPGTVVYNKACFGMGSHYAIHCVLHGVPFVRSFKPKLGQVINPNKNVEELDQKSFVEGLILGFLAETNGFNWEELGIFSLAALHNTPAFTGKQSRYIGFGAAISVRLGLMALYGESRHEAPGDKPHRRTLSRNYIFELSWRCLKESLESLPELRGRWNKWHRGTSVGGKNWRECQRVLEGLYKVVLRASKAKKKWNTSGMKEIIAAYNTMINAVHNNGRWFNKFYSSSWLSIAATTPAVTAIKTAHIFYTVANMEVPTVSLAEALKSTTGNIKGEFKPWLLGEVR